MWDWKEFITPYLYTGLDTFVEISTKHHFKFYLKENKPFVQTKDYAHDLMWEPVDGYQCLIEVPNRGQKPNFAHVHDVNDQELKALEDFVIMKEKCIMKLMYVERNLRAIEDTKWLMQYLKEFPRKDKLIAWSRSQFWPGTREVNANPSMERHGSACGGISTVAIECRHFRNWIYSFGSSSTYTTEGIFWTMTRKNYRIQPLSQPKNNEHIPKRIHLLQM